MSDRQEIQKLAAKGIILPASVQHVTQTAEHAMDAADLAPFQSTVTSGGIPAWLTARVDPRVIKTLIAPMSASRIFPEVKKGDWTTSAAIFIRAELGGQVATYGDWSTNGKASANINYPSRQNYLFQTWTEWGDRELALAGAGYIDYAAQLDDASALVMAKFMNRSYLLGIAGLANYGIMNDPSLAAPVTGTVDWSTAAPEAIVNDIVRMVGVLVEQTQGLVDGSERLVVALPPSALNDVNRTNSFGLSAAAKIREIYPRIEFVPIPEYDTAAGRLVQLIAPEIDGQPTGEVAFSEKMRAHAIERYSSNSRQKKSGGTFGAVIYQPVAITQTLLPE